MLEKSSSEKQGWILVTGGTGFVGHSLVHKLIYEGFSVRVISRDTNDEIYELFKAMPKSRFQLFKGDIRELNSIVKAFENVDHVIHVAALVNSTLPVKEFENANVNATKNICKLSLSNHVSKLVYISTCDVFGIPFKNEVFNESSPFRYWKEPYADSKIRATELVIEYQDKGLVSTILYPGWVYGPGDRNFFPSLLNQIRTGIMPIWDRGLFDINLIYIEDLADVVFRSLTLTKTNNEGYLILDETSGVKLKSICSELAKIYNFKFKFIYIPFWIVNFIGGFSQWLCKCGILRNPLMSTTDVKSFGFKYRFSCDKARKDYGDVIKTPFMKGIKNWSNWYDK